MCVCPIKLEFLPKKNFKVVKFLFIFQEVCFQLKNIGDKDPSADAVRFKTVAGELRQAQMNSLYSEFFNRVFQRFTMNIENLI
jgi:hypothetical protein